jgi:hypothetical protein
VARTFERRTTPAKPDNNIVAARWRTVAELQISSEELSPRRLSGEQTVVVVDNCPHDGSLISADHVDRRVARVRSSRLAAARVQRSLQTRALVSSSSVGATRGSFVIELFCARTAGVLMNTQRSLEVLDMI